MYHATTGIVFHSLKYGDTSLVTTIYTRAMGRKAFLVQGVYRKHSKFPPTLFQPLTLLDLEMFISPKRELQRLKEINISHPFQSIPFDHSKTAIALFLSEMLYKALREEEVNVPMFDFLFHSVQLLDILEEGTANFHLWFIIHLTKYLGFYPVENYSSGNCIFDAVNGRFYNPSMVKHSAEEELVARLLNDFLHVEPSRLNEITINHQTRNLVLAQVVEYYHLHLGGLGTIKSLQVLQGVFSD